MSVTQSLLRMDRRIIFLCMTLAVLLPILFPKQWPEKATPLVQTVFDRIESMPEGSRILLPFDYDPGSAPELQPMATAWTWHCAKKKHKMYFMALWPGGANMIQNTIEQVIKTDYPDYRYGEDYVNLGYKPGNEGVIKVVISNLKELYSTDHFGTNINEIPLTRDLVNIRSMDLILNVSAGYPGAKEWIQYAATPMSIPMASGNTGVQAAGLYPYVPGQMFGLLGAIKGAAEYEAAMIEKYPEYGAKSAYTKGKQRMGPQLIAHCVIMGLIIFGNAVMAIDRATRGA